MALRGHASIQGSTDIPTLYNLLPGYLPMPIAGSHDSLADYLEDIRLPAGFWGRSDTYMVSLLKAWFGDRATAENDFCFDHLPRLTGDHSIFPTVMGMLDGTCKGFFVPGENPAVGSPNAGLHRKAMARLDWLVVRDLVETETASFWYNAPEIETGELRTEEIPTEVFLLPAAAHTEKDGTFTNTQRLLQWHRKAVEPVGDCRSELWFYYHLGAASARSWPPPPTPGTGPCSTWHGTTRPRAPRGAERGRGAARDRRGRAGRRALPGYLELKADGSTACGCWIYSGVYADEVNQADRRRPGAEQSWVAPSGAGPGPTTGASSTTGPRPTRRAGPGRSGSAMSGGTPSRAAGPATTTPTSGRPPPPTTTRPTTPPPSGPWTAGARS